MKRTETIRRRKNATTCLYSWSEMWSASLNSLLLFPELSSYFKIFLWSTSMLFKPIEATWNFKVFKLMVRIVRLTFLPFGEKSRAGETRCIVKLCIDMVVPLLRSHNLASFHFSSCYTQTQRKNEKMCVNPCPRLIKTWSMASLWFQIQFSPVRSSDSNLCCWYVPTLRSCWFLFLWPFRPSEIEWGT